MVPREGPMGSRKAALARLKSALARLKSALARLKSALARLKSALELSKSALARLMTAQDLRPSPPHGPQTAIDPHKTRLEPRRRRSGQRRRVRKQTPPPRPPNLKKPELFIWAKMAGELLHPCHLAFVFNHRPVEDHEDLPVCGPHLHVTSDDNFHKPVRDQTPV
jgi:hypothetical protein